jgi:hypothetical protein
MERNSAMASIIVHSPCAVSLIGNEKINHNEISNKTLTEIQNDCLRTQFRECICKYGYVLFKAGQYLYHSPSETDTRESPFQNSGFYWDETSPCLAHGFWKYVVSEPFVLPFMCQPNSRSKIEDRSSELVDTLEMSQVGEDYSEHFHYQRGQTQIITGDGVIATSSGAKVLSHYNKNIFISPSILVGPIFEENNIPGWIGANKDNDIEIFIYPLFAKNHLVLLEETYV